MTLDLRRVRVGIEINGRMAWYEGLRVRATGTKYANPTQNEATVTITGLAKTTRDYLLTETSPYNANRTPKRIAVEVGRQSGQLFRLFLGDIVSAEPGSPPDVDLILKAKTAASSANNIVARSAAAQTQLSVLTKQVAADLGLAPVFEAKDVQVSNWAHTGSALAQVGKLQEAGAVTAYVDDGALVVKDKGAPLAGRVRILTKDTGMVGLPNATEKGVKVTFLVDGETTLGGSLQITSELNPGLNGLYTIAQLSFDVASHDDPFFYTAVATR